MVVVESAEGGIKGIKRIFCEDILACNITEIEKRVESFDDIWQNATLECIHKNLAGISVRRWWSQVGCHLHESL